MQLLVSKDYIFKFINVGAAALAGGVTHTLSSALIIVELTGDIRFLLPVVVILCSLLLLII